MLELAFRSNPVTPCRKSVQVTPGGRRAKSPSLGSSIYDRLYKDAASRQASKRATPVPEARHLRSPTAAQSLIQRLVRSHKLALNHLVLLRKRRLAEELKELKPAPTISKRSQVLTQHRTSTHIKHSSSPRKVRPSKPRKRPKEIEIKLDVSSEDMEREYHFAPVAYPARESMDLSKHNRKSSVPQSAFMSHDSSTWYLADLLGPKPFPEASSIAPELSSTSSVAYQANALPELGLKVRLPN